MNEYKQCLHFVFKKEILIILIGDFLKELKLTEGRNTGIPKIKRALKNNGSREPDFETNETRDYFLTTIYMHEGFEEKAQVTPQVEEKSIIDFCKEEKSLKEIMEYFGYKDSKNFRETHINPLLESGKLRQTIPDKPTSSKQKYISNE